MLPLGEDSSNQPPGCLHAPAGGGGGGGGPSFKTVLVYLDSCMGEMHVRDMDLDTQTQPTNWLHIQSGTACSLVNNGRMSMIWAHASSTPSADLLVLHDPGRRTRGKEGGTAANQSSICQNRAGWGPASSAHLLMLHDPAS